MVLSIIQIIIVIPDFSMFKFALFKLTVLSGYRKLLE